MSWTTRGMSVGAHRRAAKAKAPPPVVMHEPYSPPDEWKTTAPELISQLDADGPLLVAYGAEHMYTNGRGRSLGVTTAEFSYVSPGPSTCLLTSTPLRLRVVFTTHPVPEA